MTETLALVRLSSELATKAKGTRRRFTRRLVDNVRQALTTTRAPFEVDSQWSRLFVRTAAPAEALSVLSHVPGISSYSIVAGTCRADLDEIVRVGHELFADRVVGRRFAVRARRSGMHPFSSGDVMRELGTALNPGAIVDLDRPDIEVELEVRDGDVYFFSGREPAFGGLPLGMEGRAVALLSGGFDSAVSAWMMLKRGVQLDYVFFNLAGDAYERSVIRVAKILADDWSYGTRPKLHVVDFGELLDEIRQKTQPKYWQLVLKRLMYRLANSVARETRADAIVTGEAIGQVSSQTISNLTAIDRASDIPVFRPLLGFDKVDIIDLTRRIGTYEISSRVKEYCAIAPGNPATSASALSTEHEEAKVDPDAVDRAFRSRKIIDLRAVQPADLVMGYLFVESLPLGAVVIDLREAAEWEEWHYPGSLNHPGWWIDANQRSFDRDNLYVFYCNQGVQSVQAAESMQRAGFEAYAFRGGMAALRRSIEATRT